MSENRQSKEISEKETLDTDERMKALRVKNFAVKFDPPQEPEFEGEKTMRVTYNGRQWMPISLSPREAEIIFNELKIQYQLK